MRREIKLSIRDLVEYTERSGDIDDRFRDTFDRAKEGQKIHKMIQKKYEVGFLPEVTLKNTTSYKSVDYIVSGRADGIGIKNGKILIDEIKSTTRDLDELEYNSNRYHWAQVKCYGYFYALDNDIKNITLQLTYFQTDTKKIKTIQKDFSFDELRDFYFSLLEKYSVFTELITNHIVDRDESIKNLAFPYPAFRTGQKYLSQNVYSAIKQNANLMVEAATGIGKTISTVFPSIKAMGEELTEKIFYLTAKSTLKKACNDQLYLMKQKGLIIKSIEITAKNKICINDKVKCNPNDCEFAKGHFDRVNDCIVDILNNEDIIVEDIIKKYAFKHKVCPLELELDLSNFCDIIICDYNYVFDPIVVLKRFFETPYLKMTLLVDESHNLVSRGRDMYSYSLNFNQIMDCCDVLLDDKKEGRIKKSLKNLALQISDESMEKDVTTYKDLSINLIEYCVKAKESMRKFLVEEHDKEYYDKILDIYFEINKFLKISDFYDDSFVTLIKKEDGNIFYDIMCLNTHNIFKNILKSCKSNIFFSATLSPMNYFADVLGLEKFYNIRLESPFPKENLKVNLVKLSTRYNDRDITKYKIADILKKLNEKKGNKLVFFPSYSYLESVFELCDFDVLIQERTLNEMERLEFLSRFTTNSNVMAFCVLGGVFSEGVDLSGDRLNTVAIISVGLPGISVENNLIKKYFDDNGKNGFDYAYVYPGMNKVHQAGGRLIRTETDKGELFLIDDRFSTYPYKSLLPNSWKNPNVIFIDNL